MKKILVTLAAVTLISLSGPVFADEATDIGKKIYEKAFGRGCGTCHDQAQNPQLTKLITEGKLDRGTFKTTLKEGKGSMPKAIAQIMKNPAITKAGYSEDQAVNALYKYLGGN